MYKFILQDHNHVALAVLEVSGHNMSDMMQELFYMLEDYMSGNDVIDAIEKDFTENATIYAKWFYHLPIAQGFNLVGEAV